MNTRPEKNNSPLLEEGVFVCLLTLNEEKNIEILIPKIKEAMSSLNGVNYSINVVDARTSRDHTKELCEKNSVNFYKQPGTGQADAIRYGISLCDKKMFFILDSDCSHDPCYMPAMYRKFVADRCDIVIGSRYVAGGATKDKFLSQCMSHILNGIMRKVLGLKTRDISGGYRLYDADQLKKIRIDAANFEMQQEILARMKANNRRLKIEEVPICFQQRAYGKSTRHLFKYIWCYFINIFKVFKILHERI